MKRHAWIFVLIFAMVSTAAMWAGGSQEEGKSLLVSRWAGPHADFQKQVVKDYADAQVTIDDIDYGSLKQKQITSFQAAPGTGNYDVVWINSQWMKEYVDAGYILPLNDYIESSGLDTGIYAQGMLDGATFDGKVYGLPTFAQCLILAYDSEAFERNNIEVPETADELVQVAKFFKEKEGTGIAVPAKQGGAAVTLYSQILFSSGGYYFDKDNKLALDSPASLYAANIYDQLVQYSLGGSLAWHHDETAEAVRTKAAPIGTVMSGLANQNHDPERSMITETVKYATIAGDTGEASANNAFWVWAVAANSDDKEAAFDFISWFTSPEVEKRQTLENQQISAITSLSSDQEVLAVTPFLPVVMEQLANGKMDPSLKNFQVLKDALVVGLSEIASTDTPAEVVMKRIQEELKSVDFSE